MCPATESGRSESGPFVIEDYFYDCFHQKSTSGGSCCIRTVAATYGCKILQLYEHDANVYE